MAAALYYVTKSDAGNPAHTYIDDIRGAIVNADDGGSDAVTIAEAIATAVAAGHPLPDGYFDTVELLGLPTGGIMDTDEDAIILTRRGDTRVIA
jgi:hypothetical protein